MNNVLWTGGWDSTFRILDLVLIKGREVQPYYILDKGRKSTPVELETMQKIKDMVGQFKPGADKLIKDHILIEKDKIPANTDISDMYNILSSEYHIGSQYDWLGRYVDSLGISDLELGIHKEIVPSGFVKDLLENVQLVHDGNDSFYRLINTPSKKELLIFKNYNFPLFELTKSDMGRIAKENNFQHIMEETWFCFNPTKDRTPCGWCNPCRQTKREGLGRRVPDVPFSKVLYLKVRGILGRIKRLFIN